MFSSTPEVEVDHLAGALEDGAVVVDVREPAEYADGHVPGAILVPMGQLPSRLHELDRSSDHFLICASGGRSSAMADFLGQAGFKARSVAGGTSAWVRSGRPIVVGMLPTSN